MLDIELDRMPTFEDFVDEYGRALVRIGKILAVTH